MAGVLRGARGEQIANEAWSRRTPAPPSDARVEQGMIDTVARRIRMDPHELRDALWLAAILLAITCSYTLVKVSRDALFLSVLPATTLPLVYLIVGGITLLLSWGFG